MLVVLYAAACMMAVGSGIAVLATDYMPTDLYIATTCFVSAVFFLDAAIKEE